MGKSANAAADNTVDDKGTGEELPSVSDQIMAGIDEIQGLDGDGEDADGSTGGKPAARVAEDKSGDEGGKPEEKQEDGEQGEKPAGEPPEDEASAKGDKDRAAQYEVPEGLSERATERFQNMVGELKEKDTLITQQHGMLSGFQEMIRDTGMDGEELALIFDLAKDIKADPAKGVQRLVEYTNQVAVHAGVKPEYGEPDLLADFPDLREKVEDMEISEAMALELARERRKSTARAREDELEQRDGAAETAREAALGEVASFLQNAEKDVDWQAIAPHLNEAALFAAENLAPEKWLGYMKSEHGRIAKIMKEARPARRNSQALQDGDGSGGKQVPKSIRDVVDQILDGSE